MERAYVIPTKEINGKSYVEYGAFMLFAESRMTEIERLEKENSDIQNSYMKLYNDTKDEIRSLKEENGRLRVEITRPKDCETDVCCGNCSCEDDLPFMNTEDDIDDLLCELQDQHQQDCILVNDLTTTVNVLSGLYANLRKNVGIN